MKKFILIILILSGFGNTVGNTVKRTSDVHKYGANNKTFAPIFSQYNYQNEVDNVVYKPQNSLIELEHNLIVLEQKLERINNQKFK